MIRNIIIIIIILGFIAVVVFLDIPGVQSVLARRKEIKINSRYCSINRTFC